MMSVENKLQRGGRVNQRLAEFALLVAFLHASHAFLPQANWRFGDKIQLHSQQCRRLRHTPQMTTPQGKTVSPSGLTIDYLALPQQKPDGEKLKAITLDALLPETWDDMHQAWSRESPKIMQSALEGIASTDEVQNSAESQSQGESGTGKKTITVGGQEIKIADLLLLVDKHGGPHMVTTKKMWRLIASELGVDTATVKNSSTRMRRAYHSSTKTLLRNSHAQGSQTDDTDKQNVQVSMQVIQGKQTGTVTRGAKKAVRTKASKGQTSQKGRNSTDETDICAERIQYLVDEIGVSKKSVNKIFNTSPQLKDLSISNNLRPTVKFLAKDVGIEQEKMRKVIVSFPQILGLSVEDNLRPTANYLLEEVGIPRHKFNKTIISRPQLLACSVERNLKPKLEILVKAGVPEEKLPDVITRSPQLLGLSIFHIKAVMRFFTNEIGVRPSKIGRIVLFSPQLLGLSVDGNMRPKVEFLVKEVGVPRNKLAQMIEKSPNILGYSIDNNLRPKIQYIAENILHVALHKMGRPLTTSPQILGYSLEKRIIPRHRLLQKRGLNLGLSRMLGPGDLEFRRILRMHDNKMQEEERVEREVKMFVRAFARTQSPAKTRLSDAEPIEDPGESFEAKMARMAQQHAARESRNLRQRMQPNSQAHRRTSQPLISQQKRHTKRKALVTGQPGNSELSKGVLGADMNRNHLSQHHEVRLQEINQGEHQELRLEDLDEVSWEHSEEDSEDGWEASTGQYYWH